MRIIGAIHAHYGSKSCALSENNIKNNKNIIMAQTMKDILNRMLNHEELTREEMKNILVGITHSEFPTEQITALLTALQMRGVTVDRKSVM